LTWQFPDLFQSHSMFVKTSNPNENGPLLVADGPL